MANITRDIFTNSANRFRLYATVAIILFLLALTARGFEAWRKHEPLNFIFSDARGQYVYLPSVVIDGDLDFKNEMLANWGGELERWDYDINETTPRGFIRNKYHVGMALTLAPAFMAAHAIALLGYEFTGSALLAPNGYSLPYQIICLLWVMGLSWLTMVLLDRLLERYFKLDGWAIGAASLAFWLGSHYLWYCLREPFMIHVMSTFWISAIVLLCARIHRDVTEYRRLSGWEMFLLCGSTSMALICRPSNFFVMPVLIWTLIGIARAGMIGQFIARLPMTIPGFLPIAAQALAWHYLNGNWFSYGYGEERFVWTDPALLQTLFSLQKGLFVWTPLLLLSAAGIAMIFLDPRNPMRGFVAAWTIGAAILWYVNSSWWAWAFGWSFGARAFLELAGLFILGLAFLFQWAGRQPSAGRIVVAGLTGLFIMHTYVMMALYQTNRIDRGSGQFGGWNPAGAPRKAVDDLVRRLREAGEPIPDFLQADYPSTAPTSQISSAHIIS